MPRLLVAALALALPFCVEGAPSAAVLLPGVASLGWTVSDDGTNVAFTVQGLLPSYVCLSLCLSFRETT